MDIVAGDRARSIVSSGSEVNGNRDMSHGPHLQIRLILTDVFMRYLSHWCWLGGAACLLTAALLRWWAAPAFELLPADYVADTSYTAELRSRRTPSSPVEVTESVVQRRDQALTSGEKHSIIQGDMHWLTRTGAVIFETFNVYGVDRRTRQNLAGYGTQDRAGQYLFPAHTGKQEYGFWDPLYGGPYVARFDHIDEFHGVEVYVFESRADGIDETAGYASLPDVPERYQALTYGKGRLWIEPVSGVVVDHEDSGASYFIEPKNGQRVGEPMNQWLQRYTPETIQAQLRLAAATRWRMLALERWLPLSFAVAGLIWIAAGVRAARRGQR